MQASLLNELF